MNLFVMLWLTVCIGVCFEKERSYEWFLKLLTTDEFTLHFVIRS